MAFKIISGGQTGVDRAALDVAIKHRIECGGWVPAGRIDECGRIPDRYPVTELADGSFAHRTLANVKDSDGTVIIHAGTIAGGTAQTVQACADEKRPSMVIDATKFSVEQAAQAVFDFVRKQKINILNVAGPRESEWPDGYDYSFRMLEVFLQLVNSANQV